MRIDNSNFKEEFSRRFDAFISSSPLDLLYDLTTLGVELHIQQLKGGKTSFRTVEYLFDFDTPVKGNIHTIKQDLIEKYYPILTRTISKEVEITAAERAKLITSGRMTAADAVEYTKFTDETEEYTVVRILSSQNLIHILKDDELFACKFEMPLYLFRQYLTPDLPKANDIFQNCIDTLEPIASKRGA